MLQVPVDTGGDGDRVGTGDVNLATVAGQRKLLCLTTCDAPFKLLGIAVVGQDTRPSKSLIGSAEIQVKIEK